MKTCPAARYDNFGHYCCQVFMNVGMG